MFYRNHTGKHVNIHVITLSAGLALATAALISGGELLKGDNSARSASPVTSRVERIEPQFGTAADAAAASIGLAYLQASSATVSAAPQFATMADAVANLPVLPVEDPLPSGRPVAEPEPQFANEVDAWEQSIIQRIP